MLTFVHFLLFVRKPPDRRWVEQNLRSGKRGQTRRFRKPLVPANQRPDPGIFRLMSLKAQVARGEIEFFVIERIVGNVHLAILAGDLSIGVDNHRRVVISAGGALFTKRGDNKVLLPAGDFTQGFSRWPGNSFGQLKEFDVLSLAEIL